MENRCGLTSADTWRRPFFRTVFTGSLDPALDDARSTQQPGQQPG